MVTGARADLVLLDANPFEQISATRAIHAVFKGCIYFNRGELRRLRSFAKTQANSHALNAQLWWAWVGG
ncbi:hypothetical protein ACFFGH_17340 [Lysobacter korlensis]|uniref:Amidohydrolase-related domain-containing protein n=1 Tax=Lysobacter korlensis TaxID=553636 RepID=A0ABV6RRI9_9GAMM